MVHAGDEPVPEASEEPPPPLGDSGPPPFRLIDGFLGIMAYTRMLLEQKEGEAPNPAKVGENIQRLLDEAETFRREHGFDQEDWRKALFAVCAWIDEQILCSSGRYPNEWLSRQLQRQFFDTSLAGERFFEELEMLPEGADQVREVFDYCLSMGFQGRHFAPGSQVSLQEVREVQMALLPEGLGAGQGAAIFPLALQGGSSNLRKRRIPYRVLAYMALASIPPLLFFLMHWSFRTYLDDLAKRLLK